MTCEKSSDRLPVKSLGKGGQGAAATRGMASEKGRFAKGAQNFRRFARGGQIWTSPERGAKILVFINYFSMFLKCSFFHVLWVFWELFILGSQGAKYFRRVVKGEAKLCRRILKGGGRNFQTVNDFGLQGTNSMF